MSIEIESQDVLRLILQFLKENNLVDSMKSLQAESGISLNVVDNVDAFLNDIKNGKWDIVLPQVSQLRLPMEKLTMLYEQVFFELLESGDKELAKDMLRATEPLSSLRNGHIEKYSKYDSLCKKPYFNKSDVYEIGSSKEMRRQEVAEALHSEIAVVAPSRLLALLGQSLKYQQSQGLITPGMPLDLFRGFKKTAKKDVDEKICKKLSDEITLTNQTKVETMLYSPDGQNLIIGGSNGYVEIYDTESNKLRQDLSYQARNEFIKLEGSISCMAVSKDNESLATGNQLGAIKIWKIKDGSCVKSFPQAHNEGITSITFAKDGTQILTTSFDQTARIHGLKSGKTLKEFRGHTSFVNFGLYGREANANNIITGSADGTIKLWDTRTSECLLTFRPGVVPGTSVTREYAITALQFIPNQSDQLFVCTKSYRAYIVSTSGQVLRSFTSGKNKGGDFLCGTISPQGKFAYCIGEDGIMYTFDTKTGQLEEFSQVSSSHNEVLTTIHNPNRNSVATTGENGLVKLWKP